MRLLNLRFIFIADFCPHLGSFFFSLRFDQISPLAVFRSWLLTWRQPEVKFGRNIVKKKKLPRWGQKSAIKIKLNLRLTIIILNKWVNNSIWPINGTLHILPIWVDLKVKAMKGYSTFPNANFVCAQWNGFKLYNLTLIVLFSQLKGFKYCDLILIIQFNVNHLFAQR